MNIVVLQGSPNRKGSTAILTKNFERSYFSGGYAGVGNTTVLLWDDSSVKNSCGQILCL